MQALRRLSLAERSFHTATPYLCPVCLLESPKQFRNPTGLEFWFWSRLSSCVQMVVTCSWVSLNVTPCWQKPVVSFGNPLQISSCLSSSAQQVLLTRWGSDGVSTRCTIVKALPQSFIKPRMIEQNVLQPTLNRDGVQRLGAHEGMGIQRPHDGVEQFCFQVR